MMTEVPGIPGAFRCNRCEAEFATWQELDDHLWSAHLEPEPPGVRCPVCGVLLGSLVARDDHLREAHDALPDVDLAPPEG
jgi:DNA-directed RNA polymerase subunit RPC12/RpoP